MLRPWVPWPILLVAGPTLWSGCDAPGAPPDPSPISATVSAVTADSWSFRGTPNNWGTTAMTASSGTLFTSCQTFAGVTDPRFKIDHFGDWAESYPAQDLRVANGSYQISFDASSKQITTQAVASCAAAPDLWQFRGTPNGWATTAMTPIPETSQLSIVADFAKQDPAPRFKTDHHGDWVESYPANDVPVTDCTEYTIVFDASTKQITTTVRGALTTGACATTTTPPPPPPGADFREQTIYFVMTARFFDGDPGNNYYNRDRIKTGDPQWRGDFKGLIGQLDYLKDLGFTAIWVTPPVVNRSGLDYHGYHAYDWTRVDPRLESSGATYQDFLTAAHAKGLKVIQDVVINHSSQYGIRGKAFIDHLPIKYYRPAGGAAIANGPYQGNLGDYLSAFREDNDNPVAPPWFVARQTSDAAGTTPLVDPRTGVTVPLAGYDANRFFGITDPAGLDPAWYHLDGFIAGGDWESQFPLQHKSIAGDAIDLATENQGVRDYLNAAIGHYLDMGVDAIRLDTLKHVERGDVLTYVNAWKARKPGLFVFGENLVKGTGFGSEITNDNASAVIRPWWYTRLTTNPANPNGGGDSGLSVLDYSLFSTFRDNIHNGTFSGVGGVLGFDWLYGDATQLVTFFQNHDVGPDNDFKFRFNGETWKAAIAYNLLWTIRGIPCLYQGEEIEFMKGAPQDIDGPTMTLDQTGRAYYGDHLTPSALATTQAHPLYRHLRRLNQIRHAIPALQKAVMSQVNEFGNGLSFVRDYQNGQSYAVVGLAAAAAQSFTITGVRNGTYRDAVTGRVVAVTNGTLAFAVNASSAGIYVLDGPGKIGVDGDFLR